MKKIFEYFYLFSKFTLSFMLLFCLVAVLYIFYVNYNNQQADSQKSSLINSELEKNINKNTKQIDKISNDIKVTQTKLDNIQKNIKSFSKDDNKKDIININENIKALIDKFNTLQNEIQYIKENKSELVSNKDAKEKTIIEESKNEIIDLILVKYENNLNFENELNYLKKILDLNNSSIIEKLSLLSIKPYKGHIYLEKEFEREVKVFLKKNFSKKSDSFFSKIILPYVDISPSSENTVNDELVSILKEIKKDLENRNIETAFKNMKLIEQFENIFEISAAEIEKYLEFKTQLRKLK